MKSDRGGILEKECLLFWEGWGGSGRLPRGGSLAVLRGNRSPSCGQGLEEVMGGGWEFTLEPETAGASGKNEYTAPDTPAQFPQAA